MKYKEKIRLAQDPRTSPEVLEELSKDEDWRVRIIVVQNPSIPERALIRLSKSKDWDIRFFVANNANIPDEAIIILSKDSEWEIRDYTIRNKNLKGIIKEMVRARLEVDRKVDCWKFGWNNIINWVELGFLKGWEEGYFHGF